MASAPLNFRRRAVPVLYAVWPGDDQAEPQYDGIKVIVPPQNVVADSKAKGSVYRFPAPTGPNGQPIPGAVELRSKIEPNPETGGLKAEFDAIEWADGVESVNQALFARGFSIVERVEDIEAARAAGRPMWEAKKKAEWMDILTREHQRRSVLKAQGKPFVEAMNSASVRAAEAGLVALSKKEQASALSDDAITRALGMASTSPAPAVALAPKPEADNTLAVMSERLLAVAHKNNVRLTNAETMGLFKQDEAVMVAVQSKLQAAGVDPEEEIAATA